MKVELPPYCCDICKKRRDKDTNHWYVLTPCLVGDTERLEIAKWHEVIANGQDASHACGEEHAQVLVTRWMHFGNFSDGT